MSEQLFRHDMYAVWERNLLNSLLDPAIWLIFADWIDEVGTPLGHDKMYSDHHRWVGNQLVENKKFFVLDKIKTFRWRTITDASNTDLISMYSGRHYPYTIHPDYVFWLAMEQELVRRGGIFGVKTKSPLGYNGDRVCRKCALVDPLRSYELYLFQKYGEDNEIQQPNAYTKVDGTEPEYIRVKRCRQAVYKDMLLEESSFPITTYPKEYEEPTKYDSSVRERFLNCTHRRWFPTSRRKRPREPELWNGE